MTSHVARDVKRRARALSVTAVARRWGTGGAQGQSQPVPRCRAGSQGGYVSPMAIVACCHGSAGQRPWGASSTAVPSRGPLIAIILSRGPPSTVGKLTRLKFFV